jgi:hypothetical protein
MLCVAAPGSIYAQSDDVASLRRRMAELEMQNKQILETLAGLSDELKQRQATTETPVAAPPPATIITEGNNSGLSFYGFARLDMIHDDSRPNAQQTPTFIPSEPAGAHNDGSYTLHPRLTRIGMNYKGPVIDKLGGVKISAKIETDFQNGGSESRAIPRVRHAYAKLDWKHSSLLLGQSWDIISPSIPIPWDSTSPQDRCNGFPLMGNSGPAPGSEMCAVASANRSIPQPAGKSAVPAAG